MSASFVDNDGDTAMSTASSSDNDQDLNTQTTPSPPSHHQTFTASQLATPSSTRNPSQLSQTTATAGGPSAASNAALELTPPVSQPSFSPATGLGGGHSVTVFGAGGISGKEAGFTGIDEVIGLGDGGGSSSRGGNMANTGVGMSNGAGAAALNAAAVAARKDEYELALSKVVVGTNSMTRYGDLFDERHMSLKAKK